MSHDAFLQLAAGRVLEDLDSAESASLDDHLATCARCSLELTALRETAALMALAAPERRPPAALRGRILASVSGTAAPGAVIPLAPSADAIPSRSAPGQDRLPDGAPAVHAANASSPGVPAGRPAASSDRRVGSVPLFPGRVTSRWTSLAGLGIAAILVVAVASATLSVAGMQGRVDAAVAAADAARAEAAAARAEASAARAQTDALGATLAGMDSAVGIALAPGHRAAALTAEAGAPGLRAWTVYVPGSTDALLLARGLPPAPAGHVYQLWYADAAGVHALATFTCRPGSTCVVPFGVDLAGAAATMVTVEPAGGSTGQPGHQVAFGELEG